jgi:site-specific recombinase XerD
MKLVDSGALEPVGIQFDAVLSLIYGVGCLVMEVSLLKFGDVQRSEIDTKVALSGGRDGRVSARTVGLSGKVKTVVDRHLDQAIDNGSDSPVFTSKSGGVFRGQLIKTELVRRSRVLGFAEALDAGELRRACVRHCLRRNMRPQQLAELLGLRDVQSVMVLGQ